MMVEKYIPRRVNKDVSPGAISTNGDRKMMPGEMIDCVNARYRSFNGNLGVVENVPGTVLKHLVLPAGENKVIGQFRYTKEAALVYAIYNSNNDHRVVQWDINTEVFTVLLQGSSLGFKSDKYLHGGIIDDLWIFNDTYNRPRKINLARAKNGEYVAPYSEFQLSLAAKPPLTPPTTSIVTDPSLVINHVCKNAWQFAYQFVYKDNDRSKYSPLSKLVWTHNYMEIGSTVDNAIDVTVQFPAYLQGLVKQINVVYREGNTGNYFVFETIKNPVDPTYTVRFTNSGKSLAVSTEEQNQPFDYVPDQTDALEIVDSRVFCPLNMTGFDVDEKLYSIGLTIATEATQIRTLYFKGGGSYSLGIIFKDAYGKRSFVKSAQTISFPYGSLNSVNNKPFVNWALTGVPPEGFTNYQFALSRNRNQITYFQCKTRIHLYSREIKEGEEDNVDLVDYYHWKGHRFIKSVVSEGRYAGRLPYGYLELPFNIPFAPDTSCVVRLSVETGVFYCPVLAVIGNFAVIDLNVTGATDWNYATVRFVEILSPAESSDVIYYEVGPVYDIVNGGFSTTSGRIDGDTFIISLGSGPGRYLYDDTFPVTDYSAVPPLNGQSCIIESPSGIFSNSGFQTLAAIKAVLSARGRDATNIGTTATSTTRIVYTVDYGKIASHYGRAVTILEDERRKDLYSIFGFSNPYVQNSNINGINTFLAENTYTIAIERGPVKGLARAEGTLIAMHERATSSLYIGQGFVNTGNDFILSKTDKVVGDDRELQGNFGCINPESIIKIDGNVYWWDGIRGAIMQYSRAGLFPISMYGMTNHFSKKAIAYAPYPGAKIVSGYDYQNQELIFTFPEIKNEFSQIMVAGETWIFSINDKEWSGRYSFLPETYGNAAINKLVLFQDGQLHTLDGPVYNNFFGVQYERKIRFAVNPYLGKNKRALNVHIKGDLCNIPTSETFSPVRIYTPEGQESHVPAVYFEIDEGKWCAPILKDINTPGDFTGKLVVLDGDDIVSNYFELEIINDRTDRAPMSQVNFVYKTEEFSI